METLTLHHPFTGIVCGPTGCGKTRFCFRLVKYREDIIEPSPQRIVWCYGIYQEAFKDLRNVEFQEGMPDISQFDKRHRTLLVIDDLMTEVSDKTTELFTRGSHHMNISILFLTQNLFAGNKQNRTISLNTHYFCIFKNPRDRTQIGVLARQMFPTNWRYMMEAFADATEKPYSYLFVDLKPETEDRYRLRSGIFPDEPNYFYVPR